jgi:hypothetical protein
MLLSTSPLMQCVRVLCEFAAALKYPPYAASSPHGHKGMDAGDQAVIDKEILISNQAHIRNTHVL